MYRGIVQEQIYWTDFLKDYIGAHDLQQPMHLGRIWRIVHDTTKAQPKPALSKATPQQLVATLSHPNGWWRDTAQQLLVQRGDKSVVPQLKQLAAQSPDWRDEAARDVDARRPRRDRRRRSCRRRSPTSRRTCARPAIRLSERWLTDAEQPARRRGAQARGRSELDGPAAAGGDGRRAAAGGAARAGRRRC